MRADQLSIGELQGSKDVFLLAQQVLLMVAEGDRGREGGREIFIATMKFLPYSH
jgi:hypothetical protein